MQKELEWGYMIPYLITGYTNNHPRAAMKFLKTEERDVYSKFYDEIVHMKMD